MKKIKKRKIRQSALRKVLATMGIIVVAGAVGYGGYYAIDYYKEQNTKIETLQTQLSDNEKALQENETKLANAKAEIKTLETAKVNLQDEIKAKENNIILLQNEKASLEAGLADEQGNNEELQEQINEINTQLELSTAEVNDLQNEVNNLNNQITSLEEELRNMQSNGYITAKEYGEYYVRYAGGCDFKNNSVITAEEISLSLNKEIFRVGRLLTISFNDNTTMVTFSSEDAGLLNWDDEHSTNKLITYKLIKQDGTDISYANLEDMELSVTNYEVMLNNLEMTMYENDMLEDGTKYISTISVEIVLRELPTAE
ncbi:MAG: hypothetical protein ACI4TX_04260 [Christensenellales bacterium]